MIPTKYRTRPTEVEAVRLNKGNVKEVARWCGGKTEFIIRVNEPDVVAVVVPTALGRMNALEGDYIVKKSTSFTPVRPEIFEALYEAV